MELSKRPLGARVLILDHKSQQRIANLAWKSLQIQVRDIDLGHILEQAERDETGLERVG